MTTLTDTTNTETQPPVNEDEAAIAKFDEGIQAAGLESPQEEQPGETAEQTDDGEGAAAAAAAAATEEGAGTEKDGKPTEGGEGKPAAGTETSPQGGAEGGEPDAEAKAVEDEITALGLKEKSAERFRELSGQVRELSQRPDSEAVTALQTRAQRADDWERTVTSTGATPEQFGQMLGALHALNSGDPQQLAQASQWLSGALAQVNKTIGKEAPGYDPLDEHADLKRAVEDGDIDRKYALELAEGRAHRTQASAAAERRSRTSYSEQVREQTLKQASDDVTALNAELQKSDPQFAAKLQRLAPALKQIPESVAPEKWVSTIRKMFAETVIETPKPAVSTSPMRPQGGGGTMKRQPKDEMEAFDMGLESLNRRSA